MSDTRTNEWLSRLSANGPHLASLALSALIAAELARVAISLLGGPVKSPQPLVAAGAGPRQPPRVNVQALIMAHPFGVRRAEPTAQDPATAPLSSANLVLAGTIATQDPKHGIAIISDGGPSKVYSVGENVSGASLHSVYLDHVVLDRNGSLETLLLPRQLPGDRGIASARRMPADPRTTSAVNNIRRMVQQDPGILDQVMRTVASYDNAAGKLRGFRAYPGRNRAIFNKLGLKPGDLVTAINGQALDDPQRSQEVFNTIQTSDRVTVTIERGGQKQDISLNIAQVAADATRDLEVDSAGAAGAALRDAERLPRGQVLGSPPPPPPAPMNGANEHQNE
jgi:general secretion pathway protein C